MKRFLIFCTYLLLIPASTFGAKINDPLVANAFDVLMKGDFDRLKNYIMSIEKFERLPGYDKKSNHRELMQFAKRYSFKKQKRRFLLIRSLLEKLEFNFKKAKLLQIIVKKPRRGTSYSTQWIKYQDSDSRLRINIVYIIESEGNYAEFKLKSTFLINGTRHLGVGYYLTTYRPKKGANNYIFRLVSNYHLNGFIHQATK